MPTNLPFVKVRPANHQLASISSGLSYYYWSHEQILGHTVSLGQVLGAVVLVGVVGVVLVGTNLVSAVVLGTTLVPMVSFSMFFVGFL